ncbi:hypothetical protein UFOVP612_7 [uncultured Caudovirales phage]|uniref:Uncharacterized protein n=1 Tax=uncultured Caudovirales phage TaxID=2100421 RepID=A0A6J5N578_9CAUD|nr:hypothetical protein UFOVP612_7 [uncultured Caudovirales phage]
MINHIQILQRFNAWCEGEEIIEVPSSKEISEALEWLIENYAAMKAELAEARAELAIAKTKENY